MKKTLAAVAVLGAFASSAFAADVYRENSVDAVFYYLGEVDSPAFQVRPSNAYRLEDNPADCHCKPRVLHVLVFNLKHISHGYCS